jgi:hypothetical protein
VHEEWHDVEDAVRNSGGRRHLRGRFHAKRRGQSCRFPVLAIGDVALVDILTMMSQQHACIPSRTPASVEVHVVQLIESHVLGLVAIMVDLCVCVLKHRRWLAHAICINPPLLVFDVCSEDPQ